ncbi:DUF4468 domain-containing protein [Mucilaginibacter sp. HMF5004]|uniref:DUF4468 domain-containing protein n=1 Tax=Mucilaginibacter rivuli TaxID=2857527 RepID=UPI001C5FC57D|nr:DUF4468 domain-containing protein [Mucilaginibacter rivuli]MBW4890789.1 DUF4468 domain-containing protein [Mucilaginibacter rivuli]
MKKVLFLICCLVACKMAMAQKDSLALDDHGKYIYYKVVTAANNSAGVLYARALTSIKRSADGRRLKLLSEDAKNTSFVCDGNFLVSKVTSLAKHDDGGITCKLNCEVKDGKYRYWFTDFVFTPYMRDRYNSYVPQIGLDIPIEKIEKKYDKKDVDHFMDECAAFAIGKGRLLEGYMQAEPVAKKDTVTKKVITINKW